MQAHLFVGRIPVDSSRGLSSVTNIVNHTITSLFSQRSNYRSNSSHRRHRGLPVTASSSSSSSSFPSRDTIDGEQNHYVVLGVARDATSGDIKRAFRLLARKFHPDVSKDSRAGELFKSVRRAYEVLSNESTRIQYDEALQRQEYRTSYRNKRSYNPKFEDGVRIYGWQEMGQRAQYDRYYKNHNSNNENRRNDDDTDKDTNKGNTKQERGSFLGVLRSAFISMFLLKTFGYRFSLTFSSLTALFDQELDNGYKIGYAVAWLLGGRGGVLLTLCLLFASWIFGKSSSSVVAVVAIAMWVGSSFARYAPVPKGALLTLLYMSIKLQADLK